MYPMQEEDEKVGQERTNPQSGEVHVVLGHKVMALFIIFDQLLSAVWEASPCWWQLP